MGGVLLRRIYKLGDCLLGELSVLKATVGLSGLFSHMLECSARLELCLL